MIHAKKISITMGMILVTILTTLALSNQTFAQHLVSPTTLMYGKIGTGQTQSTKPFFTAGESFGQNVQNQSGTDQGAVHTQSIGNELLGQKPQTENVSIVDLQGDNAEKMIQLEKALSIFNLGQLGSMITPAGIQSLLHDLGQTGITCPPIIALKRGVDGANELWAWHKTVTNSPYIC